MAKRFTAILVCGAAAVSIALIGCGGGTPTSPTTSPAPAGGATTANGPVLMSPINGRYVQQNDPATNCRYDPVYGYGIKVAFE